MINFDIRSRNRQQVLYSCSVSPDETVVSIPEGVTAIDNAAFSNATHKFDRIRKVILPDGLETIGRAAFCNCSQLQSINFPDSLCTIDSHAFADCVSLTEIQLPSKLIAVEAETFCGCVSISEIVLPNTLAAIKEFAFSGCTALKKIVLPESLTFIGQGAFEYCSSLSSIAIPDSVQEIGGSAFRHCAGLKDVRLPSAGLCRQGAFADCEMLSDVDVPAGMKFSGVEKYDSTHFHGWTPQKSLDLSMFTKPHRVKYCFSENTKLHIQNPMALLQDDRILATAGLLEEQNPDEKSDRSKAHIKCLKQNVAQPYITRLLFQNMSLLAFVCEQKMLSSELVDQYLNDAQAEQQTDAVALLQNYKNRINNDTQIQRSENKAKKRLEEKQNTVSETAGKRAKRTDRDDIAGLTFVITGRLETFRSRAHIETYLKVHGAKLSNTMNADVDYLVTNDTGSDSEKNKKAALLGIEIIDEKQFNKIIWRIWEDKDASPDVVLPDWVRMIDEDACMIGMTKEIVLPEGLISIGKNAFRLCRGLKQVSLPASLETLGECAFHHDTKLEIPPNTKGLKVVDGVFYSRDMTRLIRYPADKKDTQFVIPNSVKKIDEEACVGNNHLCSIIIPDSVQEIGESAFYECKMLKNITFEGDVSSLHDFAFLAIGELQTFRFQHFPSRFRNVSYLTNNTKLSTPYPDDVPRKLRSQIVSE